MSTIPYTAPHLNGSRIGQDATRWSRQAGTRAVWFASMVWVFLGALFEGLAAYRRYEDLQSRGASHDSALRQALLHRSPLDREELDCATNNES
jgi:hypothetical protein